MISVEKTRFLFAFGGNILQKVKECVIIFSAILLVRGGEKMKKRVCVLLIIICIFVFVSCKTNAPSDAFEQTEANSIQIEDSIVPDVENDTTLEEIIPEETTPEEITPDFTKR